jgi:hypothetical protein
MTDTLREHLRKAGMKGGKATGKAKVRGDAEYYRTISKKAAKARKAKSRTGSAGAVQK